MKQQTKVEQTVLLNRCDERKKEPEKPTKHTYNTEY